MDHEGLSSGRAMPYPVPSVKEEIGTGQPIVWAHCPILGPSPVAVHSLGRLSFLMDV